ncbi:hypothetical protein QQF64_021253 [Cirrhinus molitorella]|uniref:Uncharacterized protein n=1 Tax=Cirrhinus molitorella TaxID=172907 RepID=A0ABR3LFE7_9TELE
MLFEDKENHYCGVDTSVEWLVKRNYLRETTAAFHSPAATFPSIMEEKEKAANQAGRKGWRRRASQETAGVSIREVRVRKVEEPRVLAGSAAAGQKVTGTCCCGSRCHPVRTFLPTHPEAPLCPCHSVSNAFPACWRRSTEVLAGGQTRKEEGHTVKTRKG